MNRIVIRSQVGSDGMLHLSMPVGLVDAGEDVQITVEPYSTQRTTILTAGEWKSWVEEMAGSWQGDFERPPQGEYEQRESLS